MLEERRCRGCNSMVRHSLWRGNTLRRKRENWEQNGLKIHHLGVLEDSQNANAHSLTLGCWVIIF